MPLDENLPTFFLASASGDNEQRSTYYLTRAGSEPEPAYSLRYADPASSKHCYAVALFDAYNSEVLFGEVLVRPQWTHSTLSQEEIRRHGGIPPPPEPIMPHEFIIQLYNPDQQITVTHKNTALLGSSRWDFSMPQDTFRAPSGSILDRSRSDPGAALTTPRINFAWKRETKFTKELVCYMTGKSTDVITKKRNKEPDITVAMFKSLKAMTIYEPNLCRVEMEDPKGLEVALLLSTAVIRDVFFSHSMRTTFNISDSVQRSSVPSPLNSAPNRPGGPAGSSSAATSALYQRPNIQTPSGNLPPPIPSSRPHPTDPRTEWEIEAETQRLKAQAEIEQRERRRVEEQRRRERDRIAEEETRRLRKMVEQEDRERRRQQEQVELETERLRKIYGQQSAMPHRPQSHSYPVPGPQVPYQSAQWQGHAVSAQDLQYPPPPPPQLLSNGLYAQPLQYNSGSGPPMMHGGNGRRRSAPEH